MMASYPTLHVVSVGDSLPSIEGHNPGEVCIVHEDVFISCFYNDELQWTKLDIHGYETAPFPEHTWALIDSEDQWALHEDCSIPKLNIENLL